MNLKTKFNLASACLILIVVLGMMTSLYFFEKKQLWTSIEQEQAQELTKLARVYEEYLIEGNELILMNYAETLSLSPKVSYAGKLDMDGSGWVWQENGLVFTKSSDPSVKAILQSDRLMRRETDHSSHGRVMELSRPMKDPKGQGFIRLGYSKDVVIGLFRERLSQVFKKISMVAFISIVFGLILATFFSRALSLPIVRLMKGVQAIAKGEKGIQIKEGGKDELGLLTRTFNNMSSELSKLDHLKDEFMSHVTHELRSPLTSIIATVELMDEMKVVKTEPKLQRSVDRLTYGSERLNRLVDNILDLTRMEAGKMHFDIQPFDIGTLLKEMADFFEPRAMDKGLKIKAKLKGDYPMVMGDPEKIRQVLSNLIYNAIKFTNEGGITLSVRKQSQNLEILVKDTGVGIPKDKLKNVFSKFETLTDTRNRVTQPVPGSGLGLNIVKNSLNAQGGTIRVESEIDEGSTFIFTLPLAPEHENTQDPPDQMQSYSRGRKNVEGESSHVVIVNHEKGAA